ncbi:hypothetical protein U1Q18_020380 [Sarracenia purpurea var. burkii]
MSNPDLFALKISRTGSSSHSSPYERLNGDHVERQEPTVDPEKPPDFVSSHFSEEGEEKGLGACDFEKESHVDQDNVQISDLPNDLIDLLSMLDDMTNRGLQLLAEILTCGSIKFEKTRRKMKKIIRESLPEALERGEDNYKINLAE